MPARDGVVDPIKVISYFPHAYAHRRHPGL